MGRQAYSWSGLADIARQHLAILALIIAALLALLLLLRLRRRSSPAAEAEEQTDDDEVPSSALVPESRVTPDPGEDEIDAALLQADSDIGLGLHDKALAVLHPLIRQYPQRADLRLKELEALKAAGQAGQFATRARELREQAEVSEQDWNSVVAVGAALCPADPLFGGVDMTQRLDEAQPPEDEPSEEQTRIGSAADKQEAGGVMDEGSVVPPAAGFQDDAAGSEELASPEPFSAEADPQATGGEAGRGLSALEFDLGDVVMPSDVRVNNRPAEDETIVNPATGAFTLDERIPEDPASPEPDDRRPVQIENVHDGEPVAHAHEDWDGDFGDSLHLDPDGDWEGMPGAEEDVGTKLDLARAYFDMKDREVALGLIDEVIRHGDDAQRREAESLKARL